jgi:hypothetical protein
MRISRVLVILLTISGCSSKTIMVHHILPAGFSGIYVIQKTQEDSGDYIVDGTRHIFTIPANGILNVAPDVFENYCILSCSKNIRLTASFSDGKTIAMFSPLSQPADSELDNPMLHALLGAPDCIWLAVGSYKQLKEFSDKFRKELPEKAKIYKYAGLEEYLPPNKPF